MCPNLGLSSDHERAYCIRNLANLAKKIFQHMHGIADPTVLVLYNRLYWEPGPRLLILQCCFDMCFATINHLASAAANLEDEPRTMYEQLFGMLQKEQMQMQRS